MKNIGLGAGIFVIENFLTKNECEDFISKSESMEYEDAAIQTKDGPKAGMALVFPHLMMHQGSTIKSGTKYVLRTDVMYRNMAVGNNA